MWGNNIVFAFLGLCAGGAVAMGLCALLTSLNLISRMGQKTGTEKNLFWYQRAILFGGTLGSLILPKGSSLPLGVPGEVGVGLFAGMFVGVLSMSLAEELKVFPLLWKRTGLKIGLSWVILAIGIAKGLGSFWGLITIKR